MKVIWLIFSSKYVYFIWELFFCCFRFFFREFWGFSFSLEWIWITSLLWDLKLAKFYFLLEVNFLFIGKMEFWYSCVQYITYGCDEFWLTISILYLVCSLLILFSSFNSLSIASRFMKRIFDRIRYLKWWNWVRNYFQRRNIICFWWSCTKGFLVKGIDSDKKVTPHKLVENLNFVKLMVRGVPVHSFLSSGLIRHLNETNASN